MLYVAGWIFFCVAAGMLAHIRRNRYGAEWFLVALVFSPLVAFVLLAILKEGPPRLRPLTRCGQKHCKHFGGGGTFRRSLAACGRRSDHRVLRRDDLGVHHVIEQKKKDAAFDQQIQTELAHRNVAVGQ